MRRGYALAIPPQREHRPHMISVESTAETIHVRIPRAEVSDARLAQLLRGLRLEAAIAGSHLTDADADAMAEEMKTDWWARNEHCFIPPGTEK